jgi:glycosyltransferase involved in cell wall biosynthesis
LAVSREFGRARSCVVVTWFDAENPTHRRLLSSLAAALAPVHLFAVCELGRGGERGRTDSISSPHANLTILEMDVMFGRGAALRAGLAQTREDLVAFVDLDARVAPDAIVQSFAALSATGVDGVVYDRFARADDDRRRDPRALGSRIVNHIARLGFGLAVRDVRSPLKVFERAALHRVFDGLRLFAHGFDIDLLLNAKKRGVRIVEMELSRERFTIAKKTTRDVLRAIAPLVALRLFHSPLRHLPFAELVAARYALPTKRQYGIAIFCWRDPLSPKAGGGEVYLHEQAKSWVRQGCEVTWVAERFAGSAPEEMLDGIRIVRRGRGLFVFAAIPLWHLFESAKRYDFIIDVMNGIPFFTPLYSMKPKIALIHHIHTHHFHDELPGLLASVAAWVEGKLVPYIYRNTRFATVSDSTKDEMRRLKISRLPIAIIHNGVPGDHVPGAKASEPTILYLGRIRRYKQVRKLIDAFAAAKESVPNARLVIAGVGDDLANLKRETVERGLKDVSFLGHVDHATKIRLMQEAWVFGMPSRFEGWGIVVIEAAACSTPAVAYNVNGLRDCIVDGETGFLAEDDAMFSARLTAILTNESLRRRMELAAREWSQRFSWERTAARTLETIRVSQPWRAVFEPLDELSWGIRSRRRRSVAAFGEMTASRSAAATAASELTSSPALSR